MRLLYFSPVFWSSYAQRPHFFIRHFLESGGDAVLWVDPYPTRLPSLGDLNRPRATHDQGTSLQKGLTVLTPPALPIEPLPGGAWVNRHLVWKRTWPTLSDFGNRHDLMIGIGRPSALAIYALQEFTGASSFYDAMDDFPEFYRGISRHSMRRRENQVSDMVDTIFASSTRLAEKFQKRNRKVTKLLNAYDMEAFPPRNSNRKGAPVFGYLGTIGEWFDWNWILQLANAFPTSSIRLIGPCFVPPPSALPPNVELLPACNQSNAGDYLSNFTIGLIPFKCNALTDSVDPIKYYEYRAFGLPVISTAFGEMKFRTKNDGVFLLEDSTDFADLVSSALSFKGDLSATEVFRRDNDWRYRFASAGLFDMLSGKNA